MKPIIRTILFILSGVAYADLIMNPYKVVNFQVYLPLLLLIVCCLMILTASEIVPQYVLSRYPSAQKIAGQVFLVASVIAINPILFHFDFTQNVEFIIAGSFFLPHPFILKKLSDSAGIKNQYLLLAGIVLLFPTFIYFNYFYVQYEDYYNDLPIVMYHFWIRNWIILTGIIFILSYTIRLKIPSGKSNES